jgi:hypothetical protein
VEKRRRLRKLGCPERASQSPNVKHVNNLLDTFQAYPSTRERRLPGERLRRMESQMVSNCANPKCSKPLVYLREGRIFVFDVPINRTAEESSGRGSHCLEHFWLCGECSQTLLLQQASDRSVQLIQRRAPASRDTRRAPEVVQVTTSALAS